MFVFNRIAGIFFLVLAGVAALLGISGLPAEKGLGGSDLNNQQSLIKS
jgi:hypothetical protein